MPEEIILDLYESLNAKAFDEKSFFYCKELERAEKRVEETIKLLERESEEKDNKRNAANYEKTAFHFHEALGILGERGTGKTSFLLSLCKRLEKNNEDLYFLPIVDPTLLENGERLLITVISNVIRETEEKQNLRHFSEEERQYQESKTQLVRALRVILKDSPHLRELAVEPEIFAAEALKDAESGTRLAQYFRDFCAAALNLLGKKLFVLPIDDIDMMLSHGYEVLETIRKYLSHDKILVILSGYFPLYWNITRAAFFKQLLGAEHSNLSEKTTEIFEHNKERLVRRIDDLATQYLLKIMPAYNRIELKGINRKLWNKEITNLKIKGRDEISFQELWRNFCEDFFFLPKDVSIDIFDPIKNPHALLFPFSARGFINFVKILDEYYAGRENPDVFSENLWDGFLEIYMSNFVKLKLEDLQACLRYLPGSSLLGNLAALLFEHRETLGPNYWLLEPPGDPFSQEGEDLRQIYLLIQLRINQLFKKRPLYMLDFINSFSLAQEIINQIPPESIQRNENQIKSILKYNKTFGYLLDLVLNTRTSLIAGALFLTKSRHHYSKIVNTMVPYIAVPESLSQNQKYVFYFQKRVIKHLNVLILDDDTLESPDLFPAVENWKVRADDTACWALHCFISALYRKAEDKSYLVVSFFQALPYIQELLERNLPEEIEALRKELSLSLNVPFYPLEGTIEEEEKEEEERTLERRPSPSKEWCQAIRKWWQWSRDILKRTDSILPASVLSQAMRRFYGNLQNLLTELDPWERNLGFVVSRCILAFWQALLFEEYSFRTGRKESVQDIIRGQGIFEEQSKLTKFLETAKFSQIFIYCPLFLGLVPEEVRNGLLQQNQIPEFLKDFSFKVSYKLVSLQSELHLSDDQAKLETDLYTVFSALTVSPPPYSGRTELTKKEFLEKVKNILFLDKQC